MAEGIAVYYNPDITQWFLREVESKFVPDFGHHHIQYFCHELTTPPRPARSRTRKKSNSNILPANTIVLDLMEDNNLGVQVKLLIAYAEQEPLVAIFLVLSSHRATYLYGASSSAKEI